MTNMRRQLYLLVLFTSLHITFTFSEDFITDFLTQLPLNSKLSRSPRSDGYGGCSCSKSGLLGSSSGLLHLGLGAVLSLGVIFLRMNLPSILMGVAGRAIEDTYHFNWGGLARWVLDATNDPQTPALTSLIETSLKLRSRVNSSDEGWTHTDCAKQLLCETAQTAGSSTKHYVNKFQLFSRAVILILVMRNASFFQVLAPMITGSTGHDCISHYPVCNLYKFVG